MVATVEEFIAEHIREHRSIVNKMCHLIGDVAIVTGALTAILVGHRLIGLVVLVTGFGINTIGHVVEGNLARALRDFLHHPVWTVRGDLAVIRSLITVHNRAPK